MYSQSFSLLEKNFTVSFHNTYGITNNSAFQKNFKKTFFSRHLSRKGKQESRIIVVKESACIISPTELTRKVYTYTTSASFIIISLYMSEL